MSTAVISDCGRYRYQLTREWSQGKSTVLWLMLNPSTADAMVDDRTIGRCIEFSKRFGVDRLAVCNLYAFRATKPASMWKAEKAGVDIVGPENDSHIMNESPDLIVCGWGGNAKPDRVARVFELLDGSAPIYCLHKNDDGSPKHPLYIKGDAPLTVWRPHNGG